MRARIIDFLLVLAAVIGVLWLGALVYHNRLGGHVEHAEAAANLEAEQPGDSR